MTCVYYEKNNECWYSAGDVIRSCNCDGDITKCNYIEFGHYVGEEDKE